MIVRVWSIVSFTSLSATPPITNALPVAAGGEGVFLHVDAAEDVSALKGATDDDGEVWFSVIRRY